VRKILRHTVGAVSVRKDEHPVDKVGTQAGSTIVAAIPAANVIPSH
jgi:hypothetical protein